MDVFKDLTSTPDNIFSLISIVFSAFALGLAFFSWRSSSNQNTRLMDIESQRDAYAESDRNSANLIAKLEKRARHSVTTGPVSKVVNDNYLVIENNGPSGARKILILLQTNEPSSNNLFDQISEITNGSWTLGPSSKKSFLLSSEIRHPSPSRIKITWEDDASDKKEYVSEI